MIFTRDFVTRENYWQIASLVTQKSLFTVTHTLFFISCAYFTPELKRTFVTPLIKKLILDCEIFKNYRPVSNLPFVSNLIERISCAQLVDHLKENDLYEIFQSAYRQLHGTDTALIQVQNDKLQTVDSEGGAILVLLDLNAAFDTIDHQKLLHL